VVVKPQDPQIMNIVLKRIYEDPDENDGNRVLVDRLWPRGISKERAALTAWWKEIAPSDELHKWFGHDPDKWTDFKSRYTEELKRNENKLNAYLQEFDKRKRLTLLYGTKEQNHNQAVVLKEYIESMTK